jgi:hypothetical protein
MDVVERTAMRVVVEHKAPGTAFFTLAVAAIAGVTAVVQAVRTGELLYLAGLGVAAVVFLVGLWMAQGVRTTLDASTGLARWERLGLMRAKREANLADVRLVMVPTADQAVPTYDPVLTVGGKTRWKLAIRSIAEVEAAKKAISEVIDLANGRRSVY